MILRVEVVRQLVENELRVINGAPEHVDNGNVVALTKKKKYRKEQLTDFDKTSFI